MSDNVIEPLYAMMLEEIKHPQYGEREIDLFEDPIFYYGRYLNPATRTYAIHNLVSNVSTAVNYFKLGGPSQVRIVDLGCGLGMQSIIFASLGAEVLGIDLDPECIALCRKRQRYFEERLGRMLKMEFLEVDFRKFDPKSLVQVYDGLFSMSAFAHIQPLKDTVAKISALLSDKGRVVLWDMNPDYLFLNVWSKKRKNVPRPREIEAEFTKHGFTADLFVGGCAIPHQFWRSYTLLGVTSKLNELLKKSLRLSFTYLFAASREATGGSEKAGSMLSSRPSIPSPQIHTILE
jgi:2-polyprenyl-3-methyl-5-hydroxy-6-metoxy-1,4-benzoquinol methylase